MRLIEKGAKIMPKKFCPLCEKTLNKVYFAFEIDAKWDPVEEFYMPVTNSRDFMVYEKCKSCGTILWEEQQKIPKGVEIHKRPNRRQKK